MGKSRSPIAVVVSRMTLSSPRCVLAQLSAVRAASPCASEVILNSRFSRACTFSCSVAFWIPPSIPMLSSSWANVASEMTMPKRRTASWLPTSADWKAAIASPSATLLKLPTSTANCVRERESFCASSRAKPIGTNTSWTLAAISLSSYLERWTVLAIAARSASIWRAPLPKTTSNLLPASSAALASAMASLPKLNSALPALTATPATTRPTAANAPLTLSSLPSLSPAKVSTAIPVSRNPFRNSLFWTAISHIREPSFTVFMGQPQS